MGRASDVTKFTGFDGWIGSFRALGDITGKEIKCRTTYRFIFKKLYRNIFIYRPIESITNAFWTGYLTKVGCNYIETYFLLLFHSFHMVSKEQNC